jgi:hypothetical protein
MKQLFYKTDLLKHHIAASCGECARYFGSKTGLSTVIKRRTLHGRFPSTTETEYPKINNQAGYHGGQWSR